MAIDITADPIAFDSAISGEVIFGIVINSSPIAISAKVTIQGVYSHTPKAARNPDLDLTFDCLGADRFGDYSQGVLTFSPAISGSWLNLTTFNPILAFGTAISGSWVTGYVLDADSETLAFNFELPDLGSANDITIEPSKVSWIKWSKIGRLDFTIDQSNSAGERPMEWAGTINDIRKLNNQIVVYGSNGIAIMKPVKNTFAYKMISKIGTLGKNAQCGNESMHWFIASDGDFYELSEGLTRIGYKEFFSSLDNPVLSLDEKNRLIYICDGSFGYIYSYEDRSLGAGPVNITGYGYKDQTEYITASSAITVPAISFTTNTYDFGTRKEKTIQNIEISTDVTKVMSAAINYRVANNTPFVSTPWVNFTQRGIAYLPCYGIEFQFKFRMAEYESFSIDQFKVNGIIHGFSFLDTVRRER